MLILNPPSHFREHVHIGNAPWSRVKMTAATELVCVRNAPRLIAGLTRFLGWVLIWIQVVGAIT